MKKWRPPLSGFPPRREEVACTGQGCPERERCMRWRRYPAAPHPVKGVQRWASFDIERLKLKDKGCPNFERIP